jgi:hypothetical protein
MKQIFAKTLCVAALLTAVTAAQAAVYNFNVLRTSPPGSGLGTQGWNVQLSTADNISWNIDGIQSLVGPNAAIANASTIEFTFFDGMNNIIGVVGGSGATSPVQIVPPVGGSWGAPDSFGKFTTGDPTLFLRPSGSFSTMFTGDFQLDPFADPASYFTVGIQGPGGNQWSTRGPINLTPEMPGGVLLLAALIPVGLIARKRLGAASKIAA